MCACSAALLQSDKRVKSKSDTGLENLPHCYIMKGKRTMILLTPSSGSRMLTQLWVRDEDFD